MRPLAERLADRYCVALPDIRAYGASRCPDPSLHRWDQYVADVIAIVHALGATSAHLVGAGLGGTVVLRTCLQSPGIARSAVVISAEAIENDEDKTADTDLMDPFARARFSGLAAAWELFFPHLQPLIANLVRDALPRSDAEVMLPQPQSDMTAPSRRPTNCRASIRRCWSSPGMTPATPRMWPVRWLNCSPGAHLPTS